MPHADVLKTLAAQIRSRKSDAPLLVAIDGIDASGKTTLADKLAEHLRLQGHFVIRASIDSFHNPIEIRSRRGKLSPEGYYKDSFNYPALKSLLLDPLSANGSRQYSTQAFDYRTDTALDAELQTAPEAAILLFDGLFLQRPEIRSYWGLIVFVDIPFELVLERALVRDLSLFGSADVVRQRYLRRYLPAQQLYFDRCSPKANADLVIDNRDPGNPKIISDKV